MELPAASADVGPSLLSSTLPAAAADARITKLRREMSPGFGGMADDSEQRVRDLKGKIDRRTAARPRHRSGVSTEIRRRARVCVTAAGPCTWTQKRLRGVIREAFVPARASYCMS